MDFNPVNINHINDVLPHIKDKPEIILINKEGYSVLDYVYSSKDTFNNAFARECRGIKFDSAGKIIARPYHKFHNVGENEEYSTKNINLADDHHKLDKLDGSMCHSCLVDGTWRLMTRKGESEVALKAMAFLKSNKEFGKRYYDLFEAMRSYTPIFEYVGPDNRIVIPYEKEELILTGIRHITSGHYTSYEIMVSLATAYGIPYVGVYDRADVNSDNEKEGCIIRFASGAMAKMKSEIYVRKHRSKDLVTNFKDLVKLIMDDDLDDVLPQLDEATKARVIEYKEELMDKINVWAEDVSYIINETESLTQKEFALQITSNDIPSLRPVLFNTRKSRDAFEEVKRCIMKAYGDTTKLETLFEELDLPKFVGDFFSEKNDKSN